MATSIYLRTKTSGTVTLSELSSREIVFGNSDRSIYIKDLANNLDRFCRVDDTVSTTNNTYSASKINSLLENVLPDVIDCGTF